MIPKKAIQTMLFCLAQAIVVFAVAYYFQGEHFNKVLPLGMAILFSGLTASLSLIQKGRKSDQDCDERENLISEKSMKFCFFFMSTVLVAYWSYDVSRNGTFMTESTWLLYLLWGSYFLAYVVNKLRY